MHFQTKDDWFAGALVQPTVPRPVNLRVDPFEQHMDAPSYPVYAGEKLWTVMPAAAIVQEHVATFEDFPPRQAPPGSTRRAWSRPTYPARQAAVRVQRSYDAGRDN